MFPERRGRLHLAFAAQLRQLGRGPGERPRPVSPAPGPAVRGGEVLVGRAGAQPFAVRSRSNARRQVSDAAASRAGCPRTACPVGADTGDVISMFCPTCGLVRPGKSCRSCEIRLSRQRRHLSPVRVGLPQVSVVDPKSTPDICAADLSRFWRPDSIEFPTIPVRGTTRLGGRRTPWNRCRRCAATARPWSMTGRPAAAAKQSLSHAAHSLHRL